MNTSWNQSYKIEQHNMLIKKAKQYNHFNDALDHELQYDEILPL